MIWDIPVPLKRFFFHSISGINSLRAQKQDWVFNFSVTEIHVELSLQLRLRKWKAVMYERRGAWIRKEWGRVLHIREQESLLFWSCDSKNAVEMSFNVNLTTMLVVRCTDQLNNGLKSPTARVSLVLRYIICFGSKNWYLSEPSEAWLSKLFCEKRPLKEWYLRYASTKGWNLWIFLFFSPLMVTVLDFFLSFRHGVFILDVAKEKNFLLGKCQQTSAAQFWICFLRVKNFSSVTF